MIFGYVKLDLKRMLKMIEGRIRKLKCQIKVMRAGFGFILAAELIYQRQFNMHSQKTSFIKRTGQAARREFQVIHLAVFPFQLEFLKPTEFPITAYFEKGNQIIGINGDSPILWGAGSKGDKVRLTNEGSIIRFHLYSESSVVYKWSLYRQHPSGQEEFLESCAFNLKEVVTNFILPHRLDSPDSYLLNDFHQKELRGKFSKTGLILSFALFLANDQTLIHSCVVQQYCQASSKSRNFDNIIDISNGEAIPEEEEEEPFGDDSFQSASMLSDPFLRNDSRVSNQNPESTKKQAPHSHALDSLLNSELPHEDASMVDLDQLIINGHHEHVVILPPAGRTEPESLVFGVQEHGDKPKLKLQTEETRKLRHSNSRDYSMLKLDSDQGRQIPEEIDIRLGKLEDLDLIEEERTSFKGSARTIPEAKSVKQEKPASGKEHSSMVQGGMTFRRILLFFVVVALGCLAAATYKYSLKKGKRPRSR